MNMLLFLLGFLISTIILCLYFVPKVKKINTINKEIQEENEKQLIYNQQLVEYKNELQIAVDEEKKNLNLLEIEVDKKHLEIGNLNQLKKQAEESAEIFYEQNVKLVEERFEKALENKSAEYQKATNDYIQEYNQVLSECSLSFQKEMEEKTIERKKLQKILEELQSKVAAAVEVNRRQEEDKNKLDFYKLIIEPDDLEEIQKLREILKELKNPEPLNKVIWKVYYEKPYTDLVGRVVGDKIKTGIYKITNIKNQMCYVGQTANFAERFKQHIKRGLGADTPTKNKLYPAMMAFGVENFTFEIIEECSREDLNEREQFWQNFYQAKSFGYSIK